MTEKILVNRLRIVLAENDVSNKWLAKKLNKSETTISRWCTNDMQPSLNTLKNIATVLEIDIRELLLPTKSNL